MNECPHGIKHYECERCEAQDVAEEEDQMERDLYGGEL